MGWSGKRAASRNQMRLQASSKGVTPESSARRVARAPELSRQIPAPRPEGLPHVDVQDGLVVTVQVQHDVGVIGQGQQRQLQMAGFVLGGQGVQKPCRWPPGSNGYCRPIHSREGL